MRLSGMLAVGVVGWLVAGCAAAQGSALHGSTQRSTALGSTAPGSTAPGGSTKTASHGDGLIAVAGVSLHTDLEAVYTMRPDGKQLAIDAGNLFVIGTDGRGLRQLTPDSLNEEPGEAWSPDGKWIAFREPAAGPPGPAAGPPGPAACPPGPGGWAPQCLGAARPAGLLRYAGAARPALARRPGRDLDGHHERR